MNCVEKRDLLFSEKASAAELSKAGEDFLSQGRLADALSFFLKADDESGIGRVTDLAVEEGDTFLLEQLRLAKRTVDAALWTKTAANAERLGKLDFAIRGYRAAGDDAKADAIVEERAKKSGEALPDDPSIPGAAPIRPASS